MCKEKVYYFYTLQASDTPEEVRYVGVTTRSLQERFYEHKYLANNKKQRSQPVHKWMYSKIQQGINITIQYLDKCDSLEWQEREKYWIKYYKEKGARLLNLQLGGAGVVTKEMRSINGRIRSINAHKCPIAAYDKQSKEQVMVFDSTADAARYFNVCKNAIYDVLDKAHRSSCGYIWKKLPKRTIDHALITKNSEYNKRIEVYQYDLQGNLIHIYLSIRQVLREFLHKKNSSGFSHFSKNILNSHKIWHGYLWCTKDFVLDFYKVFPYAIVDFEGQIIKSFVNRTQIARYLQIDVSTITEHLKTQKPIKNIQIIKY